MFQTLFWYALQTSIVLALIRKLLTLTIFLFPQNIDFFGIELIHFYFFMVLNVLCTVHIFCNYSFVVLLYFILKSKYSWFVLTLKQVFGFAFYDCVYIVPNKLLHTKMYAVVKFYKGLRGCSIQMTLQMLCIFHKYIKIASWIKYCYMKFLWCCCCEFNC